MSVNIIVQPHPLRSGRIKITSNPKPIAEIINSLNTGFPLSQARVCRNGEIVKDFSECAASGDTLVIKFVPYGTLEESGRGMKIGGWVLMGLGAIISIASAGSLAGIGVALIGSGLSMTLGGTVLMNVNIPTPSLKDREKPDNDPSIRGGKNQARLHGRIPVLFGRHRIYPDLAANPHTEIIGNTQYLTQLFCGGYKDCEIDLDSIKLGDTSIVDLSHSKDINAILQGLDPVISLEIIQNGDPSEIYPYCVHEDAINAPLQKEVDDGDGGKISGEIIRTTPDNTDKINVDVFMHNGIGKYDDEGNLVDAGVHVKVSYIGPNDPDYIEMGDIIFYGAELKTKRKQLTVENLTPAEYKVKIERVSLDSSDSKIIDQVYAGSVRSYKTKDKEGNPVRPIRGKRQKDLTIIALRVMATAKLNNMLDSFNYVATSVFPVHTQTGSGPLHWMTVEKTRNPASALLYALQGRAAQQVVDNDDIDWQSVETFYAWCEEHDYTCNAYLSESVTIAELIRMIGSTSRADILRIDSKISVVQDIERPAHMQLFTPKNSISYSISMFNADVPEAIAMQFIDEDSGFAQNDTLVYNTKNGNKIDEPKTIQKCGLWGVTNSIQARRLGMYNYACIKNRPFVHTIEADIEYLVINKGDWIQYAGDVALTGSVQGRIKGTIWADGVCVGIDTDEPVVMTDDKQYCVRIRLSDGSIILKDAVLNPGIRREKSMTYYPGEEGELFDPFVGEMYAVDEKNNVYYEPVNVIYFTEPISSAEILHYLKAGSVYAFGVRGYEALDLIITDIQPGQNFTAVLTCVEYSPEIFDVDKPNFILPDFVNRITPVSGAVDPGTVNPDGWTSFAVYHDSEEEPSRPAGDGQDGGWYLNQTFRSLWQSTKIAQSIESGAWGAPVRIKAQRGVEDVTPIWLSLDPRNITLNTDVNGNDILPVISQARLNMWNSVLTDVSFSIDGNPNGILINSNGLINISKAAVQNNVNNFTVRAAYRGGQYTLTLTVSRTANISAPRYMGAVSALTLNNATVTITRGPLYGQGSIQARQGDFVLAIPVINNKPAGSVFQWTGAAWEYRSTDNFSDLYMQTLNDGLELLGKNVEWFAAVFTRKLWAQDAFIGELQSSLIKLQNGGAIMSSNYSEGKSGFKIDGDTGNAEFNKFTARGNAFFNGDIISGLMQSSSTPVGEDVPQVTFGYYSTVRELLIHFLGGVAGNTFPTAVFPISGSWVAGGQTKSVFGIKFRDRIGVSGNSQYWQVYAEIHCVGSTVEISWIDGRDEGYLQGTLTIDGGKRGPAFRLNDLRSGAEGLLKDSVYRDKAGYLRIVT